MRPTPPQRRARIHRAGALVGGFFVWAGLVMLAAALIGIATRL